MAVATERDYGLFIDGETAEPSDGEIRELVEPATGSPLAKAAVAGPGDVDRAVAAARAALEGPWGKTPPNERSRLLHALADAIVANRKELTELETRNVGKAVSSSKPEVFVAAESFRYMASAIGSIEGGTRPIGGSILTYTLKEPVGVCGQIVPWNYPIMLAGWKLAPALAAGCTVVLKPDAATPLTALRIAELAVEVGIPAGTLNVVPGDGPTTGAHLVSHPGVDKVSFTGSTATGSEIMRLCADPVKRVSLELGGKSPAIVFADADLDDAIASTAYGIYYAAGQSCDARSRLLVEQSIYDDVVNRVAEKAGAVRVGDPLDPETHMGSLISLAHREKVHGMVETGRGEGAEVVAGGEPTRGRRRLLPADRARRRRERADRGPGGDLRPGDRGHSVRGREGRRPDRQRRALRARGDGLDRRPGPRPPSGAEHQVGHVHDQPPVRRVPRRALRRLQAVRLRPRAGARDAADVSGDEERPPLDGRPPDESLGPVAP